MKITQYTILALTCIITSCAPIKATSIPEASHTIEILSEKLNSKNNEIGKKIESAVSHLEKICKYNGYSDNTDEFAICIESKYLPDKTGLVTTITRYMDTTNDQTHVLRYRITQVSDSRRFESNYWFIDDFVYYTKRTETKAGNTMTAADKLQESNLKLIMTEGIISDGLCLQYDRERNQVLDGEIKLDFQPEDLAGMYESGEHMLPEDAAANEDAGYAMVVYRNFLESDEMYEFTATNSYPRGDSQAVYSIGDMNGDGLVDLWIDGGGDRSIYTLRGGELYRMQFFKYGAFYFTMIPLKDGGFLASERTEQPKEGRVSSYDDISFGAKPIPPEDKPLGDAEKREGCTDAYCYFKLDYDGSIIVSEKHTFLVDCSKTLEKEGHPYILDHIACKEKGCEITAGPYLNMLSDQSLQLPRKPVFPMEEREYLDGENEWYGGIADEDESEEWMAYRHILSGDFSLIENMNDRSRLSSIYESSQNWDVGRSEWVYVMLDCNGDGVRELFVKYAPDQYRDVSYLLQDIYGGVGCFSYKDGVVKWEHFEGGYDMRNCVPLTDGRVLLVYWGYGMLDGAIGRFDSEFKFEQEGQTYEIIPGSEGEEDTYYAYEKAGRNNDRKRGDSRSISMAEWHEWRRMIDRLLFQNWQPAASFLPNRSRELFYVG